MNKNTTASGNNYDDEVESTKYKLDLIYLTKKFSVQQNPENYAKLYLKYLESLRLSGKPELAFNTVKISKIVADTPANIFQVFEDLPEDFLNTHQKEIFISDCHSTLYAGFTDAATYMLETFLLERLGSLDSEKIPFKVLKSLHPSEIRLISLLGIASIINEDLEKASRMDSLNINIFNYASSCFAQDDSAKNDFILDMLYLEMMIIQKFNFDKERLEKVFKLFGPMVSMNRMQATDERNGLYYYLRSLANSTISEQIDSLKISLKFYEKSKIIPNIMYLKYAIWFKLREKYIQNKENIFLENHLSETIPIDNYEEDFKKNNYMLNHFLMRPTL